MKARNALRKVSDADAVMADEGDGDQQVLEQLRSAAATVQTAEDQAKSLIGNMLDSDSGDRVQSLRERLRSELIGEILDLLRPQLETGTFRRLERVLQKRTEEI